VAQFYTGTNEYPDTNICKNYYRITDIELVKSMFLFKRPKNSHKSLVRWLSSTEQAASKDSKLVALLKNHASSILFFREFVWSLNTWDSKEFNDWLRAFKPTHIFAVLGNCGNLHHIARTLSNRMEIPLVVYFTDDYVLSDNSSNLIQKLHFKWIRLEYHKTLAQAEKSFVIGEKMKKAYEAYFKRNFGVLINGISFKSDSKNDRIYISKDKPVVISFIGGIHLNRWKTIVRLGYILQTIDKYIFKLNVFCIHRPENNIIDAFNKAGVEYCGRLTAEQVCKATANSHIMLHVESFERNIRLYTKYSISTKIPEYMASKRGVIAFGPYEVASIEIFKNNGFGCVLTDEDTEEQMRERIINYLDEYNNIDFDRQYDYAYRNFNQNNMQIKDILNDMANDQLYVIPPP